MTIGIAVCGPGAGRAAFRALAAVERVARGAIGGFASFVVITRDGRLLRAETQRGGTSTLFTAGEKTGIEPPDLYAEAPFAALMSSGPNRPAPLSQFTPGRADVGLVTGHRLPNMPGVDGLPINQVVLERMARGESAAEAAQAELERNPDADAGIITLDLQGNLFAGNAAFVAARPDLGWAVLDDSSIAAAVAVLHNSIHPHSPLAELAASIALDTMAPPDRADLRVRLAAGIPVELGAENCVFVDEANVAELITVTQPSLLEGRRDGAVVNFSAAVHRRGELLGHATEEPYGVVEAGHVVSFSGSDCVELGVRSSVQRVLNNRGTRGN